jgi:hypothetical protein
MKGYGILRYARDDRERKILLGSSLKREDEALPGCLSGDIDAGIATD